MRISARNLIANELIGLKVKVIEGCCSGIEGEVVYETKKTLSIFTENGIKIVPKSFSNFSFNLPEGQVTVKGGELLGRPEDRVSKVRSCLRT